jgi:raffinose/stachyose/melibiose transport system permease protein
MGGLFVTTGKAAVTAPRSRSPRTEPARARAPRRRGLRQPTGLPWIAPAFILVVGIIYYCIIYTGYISTLNWNGTSPNPQHVGFANYTQAFGDPVFWDTIRHTILFFVVTFCVQTAIGFTFAALLHSKVRLAGLYKVIIFTPVVLAPAVMAPVFREIFAANGQFNEVLQHIGLGSLAQPWLAQSSTALPVIMAITIWEFTGVTFVLYFAAMTQIDPEMIEAARIDGADNFKVLTRIVWPNCLGTTFALGILSVIGALKTFDVPYLVTVGGPNYATEFLGTFIYRISIPQAEVGYGAALSILLLILALGGAIIFGIRGTRRGSTGGRSNV